MKNLTITIFFAFVFAAAYSQNKPCPTKAETMDWIAGKMKQYLQEPHVFRSYSGGIFRYKYLADDGGYQIVTIDLNKVVDYNYRYGTMHFVGLKIESSDIYSDRGKYEKTINENSVSMYDHVVNGRLFDFEIDPDLHGRIVTALGCLIQWNKIPAASEKF